MPKATMKSRTGLAITVEGSEDEISRIVSLIEDSGAARGGSKQRGEPKATSRGGKKRDGAPEIVLRLREEGFFDKPKQLGEIVAAMEEMGFLYPTTSLSGVVLGLVKKRELRRKKVSGRWVYGK